MKRCECARACVFAYVCACTCVHLVSMVRMHTYFCTICLQLISKETCYTLTNQTALHLRSKETHKDQFGKKRYSYQILQTFLSYSLPPELLVMSGSLQWKTAGRTFRMLQRCV